MTARLASATLVATLVTVACGRAAGPAPQTAAQPSVTSTAELEEIYQARMDSARMNVHPADVDFMTGMIAHHAQALVMSALAPTNGASPAVQTLCARIINAQQDEIATMQAWLRDRDQPVPQVHIDGLNLEIHGVAEHHHHMPGMLTQAQLQELGAARGPEFERVFLRYMIMHHQGAVSMVHDLFGTDGAALDNLVFKIASDIQVDQITEIERMKLMLEERNP